MEHDNIKKNSENQIIDRVVFPFNIYNRLLDIEQYFSDYYKEPEYRLYYGLNNEVGFQNVFDLLTCNGVNIIIGSMGSGKSTFLLWLFLNHKKKFQLLGAKYRYVICNFSDIINNQVSIDEICNNSSNRQYVFIDSLDETSLEYDVTKVDKVMKKLASCQNIIISCRTPFFYDRIVSSLQDKINYIFDLQPMSLTKQIALIEHYIAAIYSNHLQHFKIKIMASNIIKRCRGHISTEKTLVSTPLFAALVTIVSLSIKKNNAHRLHGITHIYKYFIEELLDRIFSGEIKLDIISYIAYTLYEKNISEDPYFIEDIIKIICEKNHNKLSSLCIFRSSIISNKLILQDFRHRSIQEFLIACYIVTNLNKNLLNIENLLDKLYNYETSYFIRGLINDLPVTEKNRIINSFEKFALDNLLKMENKLILSCHNTIYFASIINEKKENSFIAELSTFILKEECQLNPLVYGTILSRLVASSFPGTLSKFVDELENDSAIGLRTLNYYLFYHGDSEINSLDDVTKYIYPNQSWESTRNTLLERINTLDEKRIKFRAIDLISIRKFCIYTGYKFNNDEIKIVMNAFSSVSKWINYLDTEEEKSILKSQINKFILEFNFLEKKFTITDSEDSSNEFNSPKQELYDKLKGCLDSQFSEILFKYNFPTDHLSLHTSKTEKIIALINYADKRERGKMIKLISIINETLG